MRTLKKKFISIMLVFTLLMAVFMPLTVSARTVTSMGDTAGENGLDHFSLSSEGLLTWTSRSIYYDKVRLLDATGKLLDHEDIDVISSEPPIMNSTNIINWMDSLELDTGKYTIMVHPWFGGSVGFGLEDYIYYNYTSPYEKLEAPVNLRWDGSTAKWDANLKATSYQLNIYDASGNKVVSGVSTSSTSYSYSSASDGYWFEVKAKSNSSSPIYRDSYANESPKKGANNVTFDLNGGTWTDAGTNPQVVNDGETAIRPTNPTKSGHVFAGWYADSACTTPFSFLTAITSNKTIYAKWDIITNSVNAILSPTPSVGLTIGDLVLTSGDSSKYSVSAGYWKLNDSGSALASTTPIEAGQTYTLYLTYYPENGYNIPDDATYTVNGIPTEWSGFEAESNRKISFTILAPNKVENLIAQDTNYKTITLTWDASENATAYDVYRKSYKEGATFEYEATVEDTTYESVGVMTGKEYTFYVVAKNEAGAADASEEVVMATTLKGTVTLSMEQVSTSKFKLSWNKVDGATRYIVYRKRNDDKMLKVLTLGGSDLEYTTAEMPNGEYQFQVKAGRYDSKDRVMTGASNKVSGSVEAIKPSVTVTAGSKSAKISWKKMEGVTHYQVYRATSSTGKYTKLVTTKELSYTAKSLTAGKKYYFKVRGYKIYKSGTDIKYSVYTPYSSVKTVTAK